MHGIIPLYKPKGYTSHDCVNKLRRILKQKRVGHTGTLDPEVEGVLTICVGEATKVIPYVTTHRKTYIADVFLGRSTTTEDQTGEVVEEKEVVTPLSDEQIDFVLNTFIGEITQIPPMYSAVKVKGKRLYEYAREGIEVERPARQVKIYDIGRIENPNETRNNVFRIQVTCSKGTYIRTLCVDIGKKLGYPAHMSYLQRIESDMIHIDDTLTLEEIQVRIDNREMEKIFYPVDYVLRHFDAINIPTPLKQLVLNGQSLSVPYELHEKTEYVRVYAQDEFLAIYKIMDRSKRRLKPERIFNLHRS